MTKKKLLFLVSFIAFFVGLIITQPNQAYAGCTVRATCDAPPGSCSSTCNGGESCQINNGGFITSCKKECACNKSPYGSCSTEGSQCGGSGSDPYNVGNDYGRCECDEVSPCELVEQCSETTWSSCCTAGTPPPSGTPIPSPTPSPVAEYCGNATCNGAAGETCLTCESDCGSCPGGPVCGDGSCNGGENCSSCSSDCGACTGGGSACGNGVCESGESCSSCSSDCGSCLTCGNGTCSNGETCSSCSADCGVCSGTCGDGACTGFETCESCSADCGTCIIEANQPWWQASNSHVFAGSSTGIVIQSNIFEGATCVEPSCIALLIYGDDTDTEESEGIAITGGGGITANGYINSSDRRAISSAASRYQENYTYFYRNSGLGLTPSSDFTGQEGDIQKPIVEKEVYYHQGDLTLQSQWQVAADESYVIFVNGNLTISDPGNVNQLIDVEEGGFLAFIVSGDITFSEDLGNETLTETTSNVEGIFVADGTLTIESRGEAGGGDDRFIGEGSFISWTRVDMQRDYSDGAGRETENQSKPTEAFIFRPDLLVNTPEILTRPHSIWQESN